MVMPFEVFLHEMEVAAKISLMVLCAIFAGYFLERRRNAELKSTRMVLLGQALFVLCIGLTRILFIISDYFSPELPEEIVLEPNYDLFFLFWKISAVVGILAIIFLLIVIETYLVKSRYIFTATATVGLILALVFQDLYLARWATYITLPLSMFGLIILYFYLVFKSDGDIRRRAGLSILGIFIAAGGMMLDTTSVREFFEVHSIFFPGFIPIIIMIIGVAIYTYYNVKSK